MTEETVIKWKFMKLNGVLNRKYKVSNQGHIVLAKGMVPIHQRNLCKKSPLNGTDYKAVKLSGYKSPIRVHRVVCETFHGQPKKGRTIVNHIDERKNNNAASNLAWVTPTENITAYFSNNKQVRHPLSTIKTVKRLVNRGWTNDRIAQKVKMSDSNVSCIKLGKTHFGVEPYTLDQWL